jgi:hypothetical protein
MRRFSMNRSFAFILILTVLVAGPQASTRLYAEGNPAPSDVSDSPPLNGGAGDPDMPLNPGRKPPTGVAAPVRPAPTRWGRTVGDGGAYGSIEMMRFRAMLLVFRGWVLHR